MPAVYDGATAIHGSAASHAVALPTGTVAGDLIAVALALRTANAQTFTGATLAVSASATGSAHIVWFVVSPADITAGTHTVGWTSAVRYVIAGYRITGADTAAPVHATTSVPTSVTSGGYTVAQVIDGLVVAHVESHINTLYTFTGATERSDVQTGASGTSALTGAGATAASLATGTSPGISWVNTAGSTHNFVLASIKPAAAALAAVTRHRRVGKWAD